MYLTRSRYPFGWIITRVIHAPYHEYWNEGNVWAGSGYVFASKAKAFAKIKELRLALVEG